MFAALMPTFLHRCAGGCGNEYRYRQYRYGLRSQYGRCILLVITSLMLPVAGMPQEVGHLSRVCVCDRARFFEYVLLGWGLGGIIAILFSVSAFAALVCCCIWIQNTHSLAHSDAQPRLRAWRAACVCALNFVDTLPLPLPSTVCSYPNLNKNTTFAPKPVIWMRLIQWIITSSPCA